MHPHPSTRPDTKPRHSALVAIGLALLMLAAPLAIAQSQDWTNHGRNAQQQGTAIGETLQTPLQLAWSKAVDGNIKGSPVISDGVVVVATQAGSVYGFDTQSSQRLWKYDAKEPVRGSPAIDTDHVYIATYNDTATASTGKLHQIALGTGKSTLTKPVDLKSGSWAGPTIDAGRLFIGLDNGKLQHYATADIRTLVWEFDTKLTDHATAYPSKPIRVTPLVEDNVVYFTAHNKLFYAVDANSGTELWIENLIAPTLYSSGAVDGSFKSGNADGAVYVGSYDGKLYAFETEKEPTKGNCKFGNYNATHPTNHHCSDIRLWTFDAKAPIHSSPAIANGKIYFGDNTGKVHAITQAASTSALKTVWSHTTGDDVQAAPAVIGKSVVVGSFDKNLYVFTEKDDGTLTGSPWKTTLAGRVESSPAIAERTVFVAAGDQLYAFISSEATPGEIVDDPAEAANLKIEDVKLTPRVMKEGDALTMDVLIANDGAVDANDFEIQYLLDDAVVETKTASLPAGGNGTVTFKMLAAPAEATVRFVLDSGGVIPETSEADNEHTLHLTAGQEEGGGLVIDQPETNDSAPTADPDADAPGPGFVVAILGILGTLMVLRRRR